jgi:hypothetical protein
MASDWFRAIDPVRRALESGNRRTVLGEPGKLVAPLPEALGGDKKQWPMLAAPAKGKEGFFALLLVKAHFLMLPTRIVEFMDQSSRVTFSEKTPIPGAGAQTQPEESSFSGNSLELQLPGAPDGLVWAGHDLGREPLAAQGGYQILEIIYHELTHALWWLREYADADIRKIWNDGVRAYTPTVGVTGTQLPPTTSFTEASAYYVGDRIRRWCTAVSQLNTLLLAPPADEAQLQAELQLLVAQYDAYVPVYGTVYLGEPTRKLEQIKEPPLPNDLRHAIDETILDGLPLTQRFDDTALVSLRTALIVH